METVNLRGAVLVDPNKRLRYPRGRNRVVEQLNRHSLMRSGLPLLRSVDTIVNMFCPIQDMLFKIFIANKVLFLLGSRISKLLF